MLKLELDPLVFRTSIRLFRLKLKLIDVVGKLDSLPAVPAKGTDRRPHRCGRNTVT